MQFSTTKGENMFDFKSEPEAKPIWDHLLTDPKMEEGARQIFRYVVQANSEIKYNESLLTLEQIYMINFNFMMTNDNARYLFEEGCKKYWKDQETQKQIN